jgi:hypothetical protein
MLNNAWRIYSTSITTVKQHRLAEGQTNQGRCPSLVRPSLVIEYNPSTELKAGGLVVKMEGKMLERGVLFKFTLYSLVTCIGDMRVCVVH